MTYLEQQGYSLSVSSVCRYAQGYVENLQTLQIAQANFRNMLDELNATPIWTPPRRLCVLPAKTL